MFPSKSRDRNAGLQTRCDELITRSRVISTAAVATNKPHLQFKSIFIHDLVSTYFGGHLMP
jgi:hypothetical protein